MKKMISMLAVAIVATAGNTYAQYVNDALRFSQTNYGSTARFKAMGGAQIGVGGDMSSLGGNPAGLGLFTKSEFSLTPEFNLNNVKASYLGENTNTNKSKLNLNQVGAVFYSPVYRQSGQDTKKGLVSAVFGIGYNRTNDYTMESNYGGTNGSNSITDYFAELGGSTTPNNLTVGSLERMAYDNYLITRDNAANNYFSETFVNSAANQFNNQFKNEIRSGSVSEFNFSGALNISNSVYLGATIGLIDLRYNSDAQFRETGTAREYVPNPAIPGESMLSGNNSPYDLTFNQSQETRGSGVNGRLGIIVRPVGDLRIGATLQTPTWFVVEDRYSEGLDNRGTARGTNQNETYDFTYNLRTPLKGSFGASYIIAGQGIISADIDYVDYASIKISSNDGVGNATLFRENNAEIRDRFQGAINYRIGGEYKIENLSLRAGYAVNGSPYKNDDDGKFDVKTISAGLGYRVNNYSIDLAYQRVNTDLITSPYTLNNFNEPVANVKNNMNNVFLTLGLRF
ncbi:MAG: hypothetical protein EOO42_10030 [Flavobacteriales bacterium]|nr:MAG: hypothetical protein EOO42_10030 [Flavobacteriales bacterium]